VAIKIAPILKENNAGNAFASNDYNHSPQIKYFSMFKKTIKQLLFEI
jgi:hypothetical protein